MKILLVNKFLYPKGGAAISTLATGELLRKKGHQVAYWGMSHPDNPEYPYQEYFVPYVAYDKPSGILQKLKMTSNIFYSFEAKNKVRELIKNEKPDIVHLNNFVHQISPSILDIFSKQRIPMVMTIRDYKIVCPYYYLMQPNGTLCEKCKGGKYYFCFLNRCTKNSYAKSLVNVLEMYLHHKLLHIYDKIDIFVSPSLFLRNKLKDMGFKREILYLPNFIDPNAFKPSFKWRENSIVYFGRISYEKGLDVLIDAVKSININLNIIGNGPLKEKLISKMNRDGVENVKFLGYKEGVNLQEAIRESMFVVLPSRWYENNPRVVIEAFALGKPVVGARIGGIPELVKDNETGLTFEPGNFEDLKNKIKYLAENTHLIVEMGKKTRTFVEKELNAQKHYEKLIKIYNKALKHNV